MTHGYGMSALPADLGGEAASASAWMRGRPTGPRIEVGRERRELASKGGTP